MSLGNWEGEASNESEPEELPILLFPIPASDMDRKSIKFQLFLRGFSMPFFAMRRGKAFFIYSRRKQFYE